MGVLNVTPDSFSDGGRYLDPDPRHRARPRDGAARSGLDRRGRRIHAARLARAVPAEEELRRVLPVIRGLRRKLRSVPISIDTTKAEVAEQALRAGACIINDVSGLRFDTRLAEVARRLPLPADSHAPARPARNHAAETFRARHLALARRRPGAVHPAGAGRGSLAAHN